MPKLGEVRAGDSDVDGRREQLALNLFDLGRLPKQVLGMFIKPNVDEHTLITVDESRPDESAIGFVCDLLTAASVCDIVRQQDRKVGDYPTRVYLKRAKVWHRLPSEAMLTRNGALSPKWFPPEVREEDLIPLPVQYIKPAARVIRRRKG